MSNLDWPRIQTRWCDFSLMERIELSQFFSILLSQMIVRSPMLPLPMQTTKVAPECTYCNQEPAHVDPPSPMTAATIACRPWQRAICSPSGQPEPGARLIGPYLGCTYPCLIWPQPNAIQGNCRTRGTGHQPASRQNTRPYRAAKSARPRRRGDRMNRKPCVVLLANLIAALPLLANAQDPRIVQRQAAGAKEPRRIVRVKRTDFSGSGVSVSIKRWRG